MNTNISDQLCAKTHGAASFQLQEHQLFLKQKLKTVDRLLLFHGIGSGKTCSAISLAAAAYESKKTFKLKNKIVVVLPASLKSNFMKELNGPCGNQVIKQATRFKKRFDVMSYQGFVKRYRKKDIALNNTLVIVDEVQNVVSETGEMYEVFLKAFQNMRGSKLVCLSATPMFDKPFEMALLGNMLVANKDDYQLPVVPKKFTRLMQENPRLLYLFFKNKVSYFRGADPRAYPVKVEHRVDCVMSPFQRQVYLESIGHLDITDIEKVLQRAFLIAPRQTSNLVLPNGNVGKLKASDVDSPDFDVKKYSTKFYKCIRNIRSSPGPVFVYSNFVTSAGIDAFTMIIQKVYGYQAVGGGNNMSNHKNGPRFGVFRANTPDENTKLLKLYNSPENRDGSLVKVIIGSPTMKEGISLLRTRQIHILDPYWNRSRTEQIMGRGVRFCSHSDLPVEERKVDVFHYYAVPSEKEAGVSVDLRILQMSNDKIRRINLIETILKETAIDCERFRHRNEPPELFCFNHAMVSDSERAQVLSKPTNNNNKPGTNNKNSNNTLQIASNLLQNTNNISIVVPFIGEPVEITKPKPMQFEVQGAGDGKKQKKRVRSSCPGPRRPNEQTGECPETSPHLRKNKKGDLCCYKRPSSKKPHLPPPTIINQRPKSVTTN